MKIKKITSMLLTTCLMVASLSFVGCGEDAVRAVKDKANDLIVYADIGIKGLQEFKASVALEGDFATYETEAEKLLGELRDTTLVLVNETQGITKFDKSNRQDLFNAFQAVMKILEKLKPKIGFIVEKAIAYLNAKGVTNIRDPQAIVRRVEFALSIITGGANIINNRLKP